MFELLQKHKIIILLWLFILGYIIYFSYFSILRYKTLYSSYYDLGIMNQTVYNTYRAIIERNPSKILELTDPTTGNQIKRMAIHNDLLLAPLAIFYFIYAGPETLLILQAIILALGALAVFGISKHILKQLSIIHHPSSLIPLVLALSYLLYPAMQRSNIFDFHAVVLTTSFLLWMVYFWMKRKYVASFLFLILSLISKEQVGLTTFLFGLYALLNSKDKKSSIYSIWAMTLSIIWVAASFLLIIPYFRGAEHFAVSRYGDFGDSPIRILIGIIKNPYSIQKYIFQIDTLRYFLFLLGPLGFLSLLSPLQLFIALPEFAINLLSNSWGMKTIIFHYTSVIQPFVFLSAMYGAKKLNLIKPISIIVLISSLLFAYFKGPLPFTREQEIHPFKYPQAATKEITLWAKTLKNESLKIAATGQIAPLFSSRQYLYLFSEKYASADYVVVTTNEIYNYPEKDVLVLVYERLKNDKRFERIYGSRLVEVYKKYD